MNQILKLLCASCAITGDKSATVRAAYVYCNFAQTTHRVGMGRQYCPGDENRCTAKEEQACKNNKITKKQSVKHVCTCEHAKFIDDLTYRNTAFVCTKKFVENLRNVKRIPKEKRDSSLASKFPFHSTKRSQLFPREMLKALVLCDISAP